MNCVACGKQPAEVGVLCEDCRDEISAPLGLLPEQIVANASTRTDAALIDQWGRPHPLDARTMIGRTVDGAGISIVEVSISRHHAHLAREPDSGGWVLRDLGSANGTFANEQPVVDPTVVRPGDRISVGQVGFYFVLGADQLPEVRVDPAVIATVRPIDRMPAARLDDTPSVPVISRDFGHDNTDIGMAVVEIRLSEPTGGGGGLVEVGDQQVQLTATQLELFALLVSRMAEESHQPPQVRGFVRSSELIGRLSWDTRDPGDNHVKQLVRRVRRSLIKARVGDLVESRHRFGYRLRVIPRLR